MKKLISLLLLIAAIVVPSGCAAILEDEVTIVAPHIIQQPDRLLYEQVDVSNYNELVAEILNLVKQHKDSGRMYAYSYDGDVVFDIERACDEIRSNDPISVYAVSDITYVTTRIVSYFEIEFDIEYKRTKQQVDSIISVSTLRYLASVLLNVMSDYGEEAIFKTSLSITEENIIELVKETYYDNPREIIMKPVVVVGIFQTNGEEKIIELSFGYSEQAGILREHAANLKLSIRRNTVLAVGEFDEEILLSLTDNLIAACDYNEMMAKSISVHGAQNFAATAFGALVNANAVGEGFAMAFKALCDELNIECQVVLGYLDERIHAWNIVLLYSDYYHIDVAMCDANGIETAFLKTDADFADRYDWDMEKTSRCNGTMTYEDIVGPVEIEVTDDNPDGQIGESNGQPDDNTQKPPDNGDTQTIDSADDEPENTEEPPVEETGEL